MMLARYTSVPEVDKARASLAEARLKFESKEFQAAHDLASVTLTELMSQRRESLDRSLSDGRTMLDMARQLGAESVTLRDKMQRAEELRSSGRLDEATLLADEVCSYGRSIVSSEIDQQLTDLMQRAANARREGVEVGASEHLSEQASTALHHDDLGQAFDLTVRSRNALNEVLATHRSLKERLDEGEAMMTEARRINANVSEASEALVHAGMLLRSGRYKDSQEALERAEGYLRRQAPEFLLSYGLKRMAEMGRLRDKLGYRDSGEKLAKLGSLDASDLDRSLSALAQLRQEWEGEIGTSLHTELNKCQKELDKAVAAGYIVGHVQQILAGGRSALEERKTAEAMRAVELVRSELDQTQQNDRRLTDVLAHLEESVDQLMEMKADVKDVTVLLEQARALRRTGNVSAAADMAQRALDRSQNIARERVTSLMSFAGGMTTERLSWEDLRTALKLGEDIEEALKNYRYRHAHLLARSFRRSWSGCCRTRRRPSRSCASSSPA
jgi:tetratricopeptide (TPR) repeat protein